MSQLLTGRKIKDTYLTLVQIVDNIYYDGAGNILNIGQGTITSIGINVPNWLTTDGPLTANGSIDITVTDGQPSNLFLATPDGINGSVDLRSISVNDIPSLPWSIIGSGLPTSLIGYGITDPVVLQNIVYNDPTWIGSLSWSKIINTPTTLNGYGILDAINIDQLGIPNGVATLDSDGKLTTSQIPDSLTGALDYQGAWNASLNVPTIISGIGTKGWYYKVSVAGFTPIDGTSSWDVGDTIIFNGTTWDKIPAGTSDVVSVFGRTGSIVSQFGDYSFSQISRTPTTLNGYGITDQIVLSSNTYVDPSWIASLSWSKITNTPNSLAGYGITDPIIVASGSYANPTWITSLSWTKITNRPTTLLGYGITDALNSNLLGVANGIATLDSSGHLTISQLPPAVVGSLIYQGVWNATTNISPTIVSGVGQKGWYYKVSVAGSTNIDGTSIWAIGDFIIFNGTTWDKVSGNNDSIVSVFGRTGVITSQSGDYSFSQISGTPTSLLGYGITDPIVLTSNTYANPSWITSLAWSKITGVPSLVTSFSALSDVNLTSLQDQQLVKYDITSSRWINFTPNYVSTNIENNWSAQQDFNANISMSAGNYILFNGQFDTNWRMGLINAFSTTNIGSNTSIQIVVGQGPSGPDGFAIGQCGGGTSIFEIRGIDKSSWFMGDLNVAGNINGTWNGNKISLSKGGTNSDLSSTGGSGNYLKQSSTGANITVGTIPFSDIVSTPTTLVGYGITDALNSNLLGVANGIATLDGFGKLNSSQIPTSIIGALIYQGTWDANLNIPTLVSGIGNKGWYYKVATAGNTTIDTLNNWNIGDTIIFDGTVWDKIDGVENEILSVFGRFGQITSQFGDYSFSQISGIPTTLAGYGITDPIVLTSGSYSDPSWITSLSWSKITGTPSFTTTLSSLTDVTLTSLTNGQFLRYDSGTSKWINVNFMWSYINSTPTTLAGYGITDPIILTSGSYANPSWITSLNWSKIASTPTSLAGYGITDPVVLTSGSYANPTWITSLAWSKITGTPTFTTSLAGLTDVSLTSLANGQFLQYNSSISKWINTTLQWSNISSTPTTILGYGITDQIVLATNSYSDPSWITSLAWSKITGTPSFTTTLAALTDVSFTSLTNGQLIKYNSGTSTWINFTPNYVTGLTVGSTNGFGGSFTSTTTPVLTITTSISGILFGNGTGVRAATSGTDYSLGTSSLASGILKSTTGTGILSIASASDITGQLLTGYISGSGVISSTDSILSAFQKLNGNIGLLTGAIIYQGVWNASLNVPTLTSGTGTKGYMYKVSVAGTTTLDGISTWNIGDVLIFDGTTWDKIDGLSSEVIAVNGLVGNVPLTGTANRITVSGSNIFDISAAYVGQTSITTLGIVSNGTWQGTSISDAYILSASVWNSKQSALSGSGIVKSVSGTISYISGLSSQFIKGDGSLDSNVYLTANQTITLSGDLTGTGSTAITAAIGNNKVTYAKMQQASSVTLLGNPTGSTANIQEITLGAGLTFSGGTLAVTGVGTITTISIVTANGFAGTSSGGSTPSLTLTTTITGLLKGNGTSISAAVAGTDYQSPLSGSGIVKSTSGTISYISGLSSTFVKGDGSLDSTTYLSSSGILGITNGGTGVNSVTIAPTANSWSGWDSNLNMSANNFIEKSSTTSSTTQTLTISSPYIQNYTGTTTTVTMPVTSTLVVGISWMFMNMGSGNLTINSSGGNLIQTITPSSSCIIQCIGTTHTTAVDWNIMYNPGFNNAGNTISSNITGSSLTSVGIISSGTWQGSIISSLYLPADVAYLDVQQSWTKGQAGTPNTLTAASTIAIDLSTSNNQILQLTGNDTLGVPTNVRAGQSGSFTIFQDGVGSRTLAYSWCYAFPSGTAPILSTAIGAHDIIPYYVTYYNTSNTVTATNATPCVFTWTTHGMYTGYKVQFAGSVPTGVSTSTSYWVTVVTSNTFKISTSIANMIAGTFVNSTSSSAGCTCTCMEILLPSTPLTNISSSI